MGSLAADFVRSLLLDQAEEQAFRSLGAPRKHEAPCATSADLPTPSLHGPAGGQCPDEVSASE